VRDHHLVAKARLCAILDAVPDDGYRVGQISERDKRGRRRR
jgi:hypothetical protein